MLDTVDVSQPEAPPTSVRVGLGLPEDLLANGSCSSELLSMIETFFYDTKCSQE